MATDVLLAAAPTLSLPIQLGEVFYFVVLPMLLLAAIGAVIQRTLTLDMPTLTRLNFYFAAPGMVFFSVVNSSLTASDVGRVVMFSVLGFGAIGVATWLVALVRRLPRDQHGAMIMTTIMNNSGNYGLPLQDLAFRSIGLGGAAMSLQVFVMLVQNFVGFTLGVFLAASGRGNMRLKAGLLEVAKFPSVYALAAALITVQIRNYLGAHAPRAAESLAPFWEVIKYLRMTYIPIALCTLGAQLAVIPRGRMRYPVRTSVLLRLVGAPALGLGLIYLMGIRGFLAQVLLISTATPTAVNAALLCLQFGNHPDYVARTVFQSTLLSAITVTLVVFLVQGGFLDQLAMR
jgi:hypothetical protein